MQCKQFEESILFFIEKSVSQDLQIEMENHLKKCMNCSNLYEKFKIAFCDMKLDSEIIPSENFWINLQKRVIKYDRPEGYFADLVESIFYRLRPAYALLAILLAIFLGYKFGSVSLFDDSKMAEADKREIVLQKYFESHYPSEF